MVEDPAADTDRPSALDIDGLRALIGQLLEGGKGALAETSELDGLGLRR